MHLQRQRLGKISRAVSPLTGYMLKRRVVGGLSRMAVRRLPSVRLRGLGVSTSYKSSFQTNLGIMSGLREKMDEEVERRRKQSEDLEQIRELLEEVTDARVSVTLEDIRDDMATFRKTAARVAKTFQDREEKLQAIDRAAENARDSAKEMADESFKLRFSMRLERIAMMVGSIISTLILLWILSGLSLYALPQDLRMTEEEQRKLQELSKIGQATTNMSEEESETYERLINENLPEGESSPTK
jgi:hypothetical protein